MRTEASSSNQKRLCEVGFPGRLIKILPERRGFVTADREKPTGLRDTPAGRNGEVANGTIPRPDGTVLSCSAEFPSCAEARLYRTLLYLDLAVIG